jgi:hypothetical protein
MQVDHTECFHDTPSIEAWPDQPLGAETMESAVPVFEVGFTDGGSPKLTLHDDLPPPDSARWRGRDGRLHVTRLAAPITRRSDHLLVAGVLTTTNPCTSDTTVWTRPPTLNKARTDSEGHRWARIGYEAVDPWRWHVAWIVGYEDAAGLKVFRWIQPAERVDVSYHQPETTVPASATHAIPAKLASPLAAEWGSFDWSIEVLNLW